MSGFNADNMQYAAGWKPEEGAVLVGEITAVDSGWSDWRNANYPIITVAPEGGGDEVAVHCFHAALFNRVMSLQPRVGERIGFQYQGKRPSKNNPRNTVAVYAVRLDRKNDNPYERIRQSQPDKPQAPPQSDIPADAEDFAPGNGDAPADDDIPF